jgi:hypothetical protein
LFKSIAKKRRRLQEVEIFQKRNKELVDTTVKAEMAKRVAQDAKSKVQNRSHNENGRCSGDARSSGGDSVDAKDSDDESGSSSDSDDDSNSDDDSDTKDPTSKGKGRSQTKMDGITRAKAMSLRRQIAQTLLDNASAEEKEIVAKLYREQKGIVADDVFDKSVEERTPEEIQSCVFDSIFQCAALIYYLHFRALDELEGIMAEFHAGVYTMTGWLGITLLGGPTPEENGSVTQKT